MAIEINKSDNRIDRPVVTLAGLLVDTTTGIYTQTTTTDIANKHETNYGAQTGERQQPVQTYSGDVTVTITAQDVHSAGQTAYNSDAANEGNVGRDVDKDEVNKTLDTYYTLNGKDPNRTKANLLTRGTSTLTVRANESGSDNVILKIKTYGRGLESEMTTVEFRVIRADDNTVKKIL